SQAVLPPDSVYTADNGTHGFPVTLNTGGTQTLTVTDTGTGLTGAQMIQVSNPLPVLTTLSPTSATANGAPITLAVTGSNFVATSVVRWDGNPLVTTFINPGQLQAIFPTGSIAGTAAITVLNPGPAGGESAAGTLTLNVNIPVLPNSPPPANLI